jgi:hypothetical protein
MRPVTITCERCKHAATVEHIERLVGKTLRCSRCGRRQAVQWGDPDVRRAALERFGDKIERPLAKTIAG